MPKVTERDAFNFSLLFLIECDNVYYECDDDFQFFSIVSFVNKLESIRSKNELSIFLYCFFYNCCRPYILYYNIPEADFQFFSIVSGSKQ